MARGGLVVWLSVVNGSAEAKDVGPSIDRRAAVPGPVSVRPGLAYSRRMMISSSEISGLARERLSADLADRYCSLLRPSGRILSAAQPGDQRVGALCGEPRLPESVDWPVWEGHGPLSFVVALDCGRLSATDTGLPFPADGALLFFYFDGQADNYQSWVHPSEPESGPAPGSCTSLRKHRTATSGKFSWTARSTARSAIFRPGLLVVWPSTYRAALSALSSGCARTVRAWPSAVR